MAADPSPELSFYRRILRVVAFLVLILPALVALGLGALSDFGVGVKPLFFEVMAAGVLPVLLVACIVQYGAIFARTSAVPMSEQDREIVRYKHARFTELYGLIFLAGEGAALYAIAAGEQSTFLLAATALYGLVLLALLLGEVRGLADEPDAFLPATRRRKREALERAKKA